ncbi:H+/gluconate symporter family protein [Methanolobus tindarius DSM 2278]|uniref:H+/gluconate symporter family protein n=1 Tax=Methanolobus tindarius DSM 2278 TaxID=1090322 RepID=W9DUZ5_METTI|nr:GntP family permease [Methanolobus tindarius]ETA67241.1 H+/gluconate symporter family protein [Methanolobus tindarius DSM 2278]
MNSIVIFLLSLLLILFLTAKLRLHPFIGLILTSVITGMLAGEASTTIETITTGMGKVFSHFAIIIASGSIIGLILHRTGGAKLIASDIIKISRKPLFGLNILGFIFAVPLMCCILAYVIFIPVAKEIRIREGLPKVLTASVLVFGTLASYNLVYPSPVVYSAVYELGIKTSDILFPGVVIAFIVSIAGYFYAMKFCKTGNFSDFIVDNETENENMITSGRIAAYSPIAIPVVLILTDVFTNIPLFDILGEPDMALLIGVVMAIFFAYRQYNFNSAREWVEKAIKRSGVVILDMCGGGALGATLAMTGVGQEMGTLLAGLPLPAILVPFLISVAIQSVQGSRVVTMLVTPSIVIPLVPVLGLPPEIVLFSMASGTFLISHFNDPFFWIYKDLAELETKEVLKSYTLGGVVMGMCSLMLTGVAYLLLY